MPSPVKSRAAKEAVEPPVMNVAGAPRPPVPFPSSLETALDVMPARTTSGRRSPLTSTAVTCRVSVPASVGYCVGAPRPPDPFPRRSETVANPEFETTTRAVAVRVLKSARSAKYGFVAAAAVRSALKAPAPSPSNTQTAGAVVVRSHDVHPAIGRSCRRAPAPRRLRPGERDADGRGETPIAVPAEQRQSPQVRVRSHEVRSTVGVEVRRDQAEGDVAGAEVRRRAEAAAAVAQPDREIGRAEVRGDQIRTPVGVEIGRNRAEMRRRPHGHRARQGRAPAPSPRRTVTSLEL